ncbi:type III secretion system cytoplasmic ring protein SctQ [Myxococcus sp. K15C18031901]|uniref:type III secretion system cytoplasmic ring protein SctQ n=1 Tax=Myxococcus dinghuensis TaxID=2906761 RepID=UPI0020A8144C|nr:type III secretion system cytoplasmic ring protein SctQ [Myxococcus dinghuensis]MCP3103311.1 type III secretion system cytoplasmic ring protein SctQ [Myxococcus dinghuensis]
MNHDTVPSITVEVAPLRRLGARRMSRAHLVLMDRPRVGQLGRVALRSVCEALGRELGTPVTAEARLLDALVSPVGGLARPAIFALFELSAVGGTAVLELDPAVAIAGLERIAGAGARPGVVTELSRLEDATLGYLMLVGLSALRSLPELHALLAPRLTRVTMKAEDVLARLEGRPSWVAVELRLGVGEVSAGGRLLVPAQVLQSVFQALPAERREGASEVLTATLALRVLMGRTGLTGTSAESLAEGDVVLLEGLRREGPALRGRGRLVARGFELQGEFQSGGFSLTRARTRALSQESDMVTSDEGLAEMPPLPVDVEVELTRVMVSLSELATLKPGSLLPLHMNAVQPVLLRVGERAVARAELVEIEGEVGARILALLP